MQNSSGLRIALLHPDLGIGGAERLVVDAALALKAVGHTVHFWTSHHNASHCFRETCDGTFPVITVADWFPRQIYGRLSIICTMIRAIILSVVLLWNWDSPSSITTAAYLPEHDYIGAYDIVITDQLALYNLFLLFTESRTIFYCHFPDRLLATKEPNGLLNTAKTVYRVPINLLEEFSTGCANTILVNSLFTRDIFSYSFTHLSAHLTQPPAVLYPTIQQTAQEDGIAYDRYMLSLWKPNTRPVAQPEFMQQTDYQILHEIPHDVCVFVSINRFERKKEIDRIIRAFSLFRSRVEVGGTASQSSRLQHDTAPIIFTASKLIIAGGYDPKMDENVSYYNELYSLTERLELTPTVYPDVSGDVIFLRSFTFTQRLALIRRSQAVIYTPQNEHFGIVPLEAMDLRRPVIACNSGGPKESIVHGVTGFLCYPSDQCFADALANVFFGGGGAVNQFQKTPYHDIQLLNNLEDVLPTSYNRIDQSTRLAGIAVPYSEFIFNHHAHLHVKRKFGIQSFTSQWNALVTKEHETNLRLLSKQERTRLGYIKGRAMPPPQQSQHSETYQPTRLDYFRSYLCMLGPTPRARLLTFITAACTLIFVLIYLCARWLR